MCLCAYGGVSSAVGVKIEWGNLDIAVSNSVNTTTFDTQAAAFDAANPPFVAVSGNLTGGNALTKNGNTHLAVVTTNAQATNQNGTYFAIGQCPHSGTV